MPRRFTPAEAKDFFARFAKRDPNPRTELAYNSPYTLLVAVVLSAQATDKGVNKATAQLFPDGEYTGKNGGARRARGCARRFKTIWTLSHQSQRT